MKLGGIIAQGMLGGIAGAAQGAAMSAAEEQKQAMLAKREEQLAKLRGEERRESLKAETAELAVREDQKRGIIQKQMQSVSERESALRQADESAALSRVNAVNTDPSTNVTPEEAAGMPPETRKLYDLPVDDEKSRLGRRIKAAEEVGVLDAAKDAREGLKIVQTAERDEKKDAAMNRRLDVTEEYQRRSAERADRLAALREANLARAESGATERARIQAEREQRLATQESLRAVQADIKNIQSRIKDTFGPEQDALKTELTKLSIEARRYRSALGGKGYEMPAEETPQPPANRPPLQGFIK